MRQILLSIILLFSACQTSLPLQNYKVSDREKIADKITAEVAKKIETQTGLKLSGVGGGAIEHIRKLNMSFECRGMFSMEQGRELVLYCVKEYLSAINSSEEIRPHLVHYPFTPNDIEITIYIRQTDGREVPLGDLAIVNSVEGMVEYYVKQPGAPSIRIDCKETYEESVSILESEPVINKIRKNTFNM